MQPRSTSASLPAPIGGLNYRDSVSMMAETDALELDNLFPSPTDVNLRKGWTSFATFTGTCQSIVLYGSSEVFVAVYDATDYGLFDATSGGALSTEVVGGSGDTVQELTSVRFDYQNFGTTGGQFLTLVNGADTPLQYDGSTWSASSMTGSGLTTSNLSSVTSFAERLWYIEAGTFNVWYLPVKSITGTLTKLNLGSLFRFGGALSNLVTFSADTGSILADFIGFVSTEGEVVVFAGDDPASITTWTRFAQFRIGKPVTAGNRAWCKVSNEAVLLTSDGAVPMSVAMMQDRADVTAAITDRIRTRFNQDVVDHSSRFGWSVILHPAGQKLVINVPTAELSTSYQWVMNTQTRRWCRFTDWDAYCFAASRDTLYYGGDGFLAKADTGLDDNGSAIIASGRQAFTYLGKRGQQKFITMMRPILTLDGPVNISLGVDVDYQDVEPSGQIALAGNAGDPWETAWDAAWTGAAIVYRNWHSAGGIGHAISPRIGFQATGINLSWSATDLVYELGGVL